jgi:hypothetical protein
MHRRSVRRRRRSRESRYKSFTYDFRSQREILEIQSAWLKMGPYQWRAFENDQYGTYIVAREPRGKLKIRVLGTAPDYSLEIDFDVGPGLVEETRARIFKAIFDSLLPAVDATDLRETSWETTKTPKPR